MSARECASAGIFVAHLVGEDLPEHVGNLTVDAAVSELAANAIKGASAALRQSDRCALQRFIFSANFFRLNLAGAMQQLGETF